MKIGVLALQGDFAEHIAMLRRLGAETVEVRLKEHLQSLDGLIIPGGESTTIGKLATDYELIEPLRQLGKEKAIWGTCAGAIFLSNDSRRQQPLLNLMDIHESSTRSQVKSLVDVIRKTSERKNKICELENSIIVLIVRSEQSSVKDLVHKINEYVETRSNGLNKHTLEDISVGKIEINDSINNAEQMISLLFESEQEKLFTVSKI